MDFLGDRICVEVSAKIRGLLSCDNCKKPIDESYLLSNCKHYACASCAKQSQNECLKCASSGGNVRIDYLDPILQTLTDLKSVLFDKEALPSPISPGTKRKAADDSCITPKSSNRKAAKITGMSPIASIFATKSTPSTPKTLGSTPLVATPLSALRTPKSGNQNADTESDFGGFTNEDSLLNEIGNKSTPPIIVQSEQVPVLESKPEPTAQSETRCESCQASRIRRSETGVQASNCVSTLDVSTVVKPNTVDAEVQTESADTSSSCVTESVGVQTERPHVPVKRYFEIETQTEPIEDDAEKTIESADGTVPTSTQSADQTLHAQPISLDLSPIKLPKNKRKKSSNKVVSGNEVAEETVVPINDAAAAAAAEGATIVNKPAENVGDVTAKKSSLRSEKDSMDSLSYETMEIQKISTRKSSKRATRQSSDSKQQGPVEPDSMDSLPSELFNQSKKVATPKKNAKKSAVVEQQKDSLESFFKNSHDDAVSIPETEPVEVSPAMTPRKTPAQSRTEEDQLSQSSQSPFTIQEKRKTIVFSDDEETSSKTNKRSKNNDSHSKALPSFSSDEEEGDGADALPMDTEDMRNLEKEIENLDREMESNKSCGR